MTRKINSDHLLGNGKHQCFLKSLMCKAKKTKTNDCMIITYIAFNILNTVKHEQFKIGNLSNLFES